MLNQHSKMCLHNELQLPATANARCHFNSQQQINFSCASFLSFFRSFVLFVAHYSTIYGSPLSFRVSCFNQTQLGKSLLLLSCHIVFIVTRTFVTNVNHLVVVLFIIVKVLGASGGFVAGFAVAVLLLHALVLGASILEPDFDLFERKRSNKVP